MIVFRLSRTGKKKQPYFRVVVQDKRTDPWSPAIEVVGNLNPRMEKADAVLDKERIAYWLSKGAQPSPTVRNLFIDLGLMEGKKAAHSSITAKRAKSIAEKAAKPATE